MPDLTNTTTKIETKPKQKVETNPEISTIKEYENVVC